jgi:hypothetical protein
MESIGTTGITSATDSGTSYGGGSGTNTGFGNTNTGTGTCASCGQPLAGNSGLDQFLGKLGITDEMISNLKSSMQNIDVEEYLNTARDYLKSGTNKATEFAKENPGKVAAGAAVLALGAGLMIAALNRDK